jgi:hypothetical protein
LFASQIVVWVLTCTWFFGKVLGIWRNFVELEGLTAVMEREFTVRSVNFTGEVTEVLEGDEADAAETGQGEQGAAGTWVWSWWEVRGSQRGGEEGGIGVALHNGGDGSGEGRAGTQWCARALSEVNRISLNGSEVLVNHGRLRWGWWKDGKKLTWGQGDYSFISADFERDSNLSARPKTFLVIPSSGLTPSDPSRENRKTESTTYGLTLSLA